MKPLADRAVTEDTEQWRASRLKTGSSTRTSALHGIHRLFSKDVRQSDSPDRTHGPQGPNNADHPATRRSPAGRLDT